MLTENECRNAQCPTARTRIRLADSGGLYLEVAPISKRWFWKYRFVGKEKRLALSAPHADYVLRRLEADVFPDLRRRPISEITAPPR